jgi:hypothetical protein
LVQAVTTLRVAVSVRLSTVVPVAATMSSRAERPDIIARDFTCLPPLFYVGAMDNNVASVP